MTERIPRTQPDRPRPDETPDSPAAPGPELLDVHPGDGAGGHQALDLGGPLEVVQVLDARPARVVASVSLPLATTSVMAGLLPKDSWAEGRTTPLVHRLTATFRVPDLHGA